ncbi:hypothetical protein AJ79_03327 [Helicocarpus griseus UAMH5409]|uniref:Uncharacterized protein n=1 Tax=Helicocarpus griseus UAMH5409 TaxID=1447875 RepID=A0A2B7XZ60_9EURO|nr:hypothetical protein AJ79_03327 [Helicocarpus griseus UAMH5409]
MSKKKKRKPDDDLHDKPKRRVSRRLRGQETDASEKGAGLASTETLTPGRKAYWLELQQEIQVLEDACTTIHESRRLKMKKVEEIKKELEDLAREQDENNIKIKRKKSEAAALFQG